MLFAELFYTLFFTSLANKQNAILFGHDTIVEPLYHHTLFLGGVHDAIVRIEELNVVSDAGIAIKVALRLLPKAAPSA